MTCRSKKQTPAERKQNGRGEERERERERTNKQIKSNKNKKRGRQEGRKDKALWREPEWQDLCRWTMAKTCMHVPTLWCIQHHTALPTAPRGFLGCISVRTRMHFSTPPSKTKINRSLSFINSNPPTLPHLEPAVFARPNSSGRIFSLDEVTEALGAVSSDDSDGTLEVGGRG